MMRRYSVGDKVYFPSSPATEYEVVSFSYASVIDGATIPRYNVERVSGSNTGKKRGRREDVLETDLIRSVQLRGWEGLNDSDT